MTWLQKIRFPRFQWLLGLLLIVGTLAPAQQALAGPKKNEPRITKAEFEALRSGMTYNQVVEIVGSEGELLGETGFGGVQTVIYMWRGRGPGNSNANVTFYNGQLVSKAQVNLR